MMVDDCTTLVFYIIYSKSCTIIVHTDAAKVVIFMFVGRNLFWWIFWFLPSCGKAYIKLSCFLFVFFEVLSESSGCFKSKKLNFHRTNFEDHSFYLSLTPTSIISVSFLNCGRRITTLMASWNIKNQHTYHTFLFKHSSWKVARMSL